MFECSRGVPNASNLFLVINIFIKVPGRTFPVQKYHLEDIVHITNHAGMKRQVCVCVCVYVFKIEFCNVVAHESIMYTHMCYIFSNEPISLT